MSTSVPAAVVLKVVRGWRLFPRHTEIDRAVMAAHPSHLAGSSGCRWLMSAAEMAGLACGSWRPSQEPAAMGWACPPRIATHALSAQAGSVRAARDFTVATLRRWDTAHSSQDIAIVVSELLTNALRHALPGSGGTRPRRPVRLGLLQQGPWLLCAVADPSKAIPVPRTPGSLAEAGRGLQMICAFSDQWGYTTPSDAGKVVWAMFTAQQAGYECLAGEVVDRVAVGAVGGAQGCGDGRGLAGELGEPGAQEPGVQAGEEQGVAESGAGDLVAVGTGDPLDEAVDAQSPEVVGDLPAGHVLISPAGEGREVGAEFAVGESAGQQPEGAQGREQALAAFVGEAQAGDAGPGGGGDGGGDRGDRGGSGGGVVADFLDAGQAPLCGPPRELVVSAQVTAVDAAAKSPYFDWITAPGIEVSRWTEEATGWSIKKLVRTARRHRTIEIEAGARTITAAEPLSDHLRQSLQAIRRTSRRAHELEPTRARDEAPNRRIRWDLLLRQESLIVIN